MTQLDRLSRAISFGSLVQKSKWFGTIRTTEDGTFRKPTHAR